MEYNNVLAFYWLSVNHNYCEENIPVELNITIMYCPVPHQTTILHGQKYPKNGSPLHQCCSCFIFSAWNKLLESLAHFSDKCGILLHSVYLSFYSLTNKVGVSYMYNNIHRSFPPQLL